MAKGRSKGRDVTTSVANELRSWTEPSLPDRLVGQRPVLDLTEVEDLRAYSPDGAHPKTTQGTRAHFDFIDDLNAKWETFSQDNAHPSKGLRKYKNKWELAREKAYQARNTHSSSKSHIVFREPASQIMVCVRRRIRREILHALHPLGKLSKMMKSKHTGRGKNQKWIKLPRKTALSKIICR